MANYLFQIFLIFQNGGHVNLSTQGQHMSNKTPPLPLPRHLIDEKYHAESTSRGHLILCILSQPQGLTLTVELVDLSSPHIT